MHSVCIENKQQFSKHWNYFRVFGCLAYVHVPYV